MGQSLKLLFSEILLDALADGFGIGGDGDGELDGVCHAEVIQPIQQIGNSVLAVVVQHLVEIVYKNVGDIIVACMEAADKATEKIIGVDAVFAGMNKACGIGYIVSEVLVLLDADYVAAFFCDSLNYEINKSFGFAGALETHDKLNHFNHAPFVVDNNYYLCTQRGTMLVPT